VRLEGVGHGFPASVQGDRNGLYLGLEVRLLAWNGQQEAKHCGNQGRRYKIISRHHGPASFYS